MRHKRLQQAPAGEISRLFYLLDLCFILYSTDTTFLAHCIQMVHFSPLCRNSLPYLYVKLDDTGTRYFVLLLLLRILSGQFTLQQCVSVTSVTFLPDPINLFFLFFFFVILHSTSHDWMLVAQTKFSMTYKMKKRNYIAVNDASHHLHAKVVTSSGTLFILHPSIYRAFDLFHFLSVVQNNMKNLFVFSGFFEKH